MCFCAYGVSNGKKHFFFFLFLPLNCIYLFGVLGSKKTKTNCSLQCTGITVVQWKRCTQNMLASMVRCSLFKPQQNEEKNRTNNDVIAPFRFCTKRWNISLWFFCFFFVNSLLLKTCVPCVHAKKRNNQQWQRRVNRHFIATVAQFVCKKSHHPTVTFTFAKHSSSSSSLFLQTYSILHACKLIYYSWKKSREIIRFDDDSKYFIIVRKRICFIHTLYVSLPAVCMLMLVFVLVFVWNAYTPVG